MTTPAPPSGTFAFGTYLTPAERTARGKAARESLTRKAQAVYEPAAHRPDPIALLEDQEQTRVPSLLPLRHERMGVSAFTFYRGTAIIMASDLGAQPSSGLQVQLCGDAHLSNFGLFAAPDRVPVFDVNDFDETNPGPFEWDVKRLATSFVLAARDNGFPEEVIADAALASARQYRLSMAEYAAMKEIDIWYDRVDASAMEAWGQRTSGKIGEKAVRRTVAKAQARTAWTAVRKLTTVEDGHRVFVDQPPLVVRVPEDSMARAMLLGALPGYLESLAPDRRALLERYEQAELARFPDRVLGWLRAMDDHTGYRVTRLGHSLQAATRAHRAGEDEETVVCALVHDIGDVLAPANHSEVAAAVVGPYVSERNHWILRHHGLFQGVYWFHHVGADPALEGHGRLVHRSLLVSAGPSAGIERSLRRRGHAPTAARADRGTSAIGRGMWTPTGPEHPAPSGRAEPQATARASPCRTSS